jgi:hypothetical protein
MGALRYLRLILREALGESLDLAQAVLFLAIIVAGGVIAMLPQFSAAHSFPDVFNGLVSWKGAAIVLGSVVATRLLVAPYRLWKGETEKVATLEARLAPKIRLSFDPDSAGIQQTPIQTVTKITVPPIAPLGANVPGTPEGVYNLVQERPATYLRVHAVSLSSITIAGCWAYITEIEKVTADGVVTPVLMPHGIKLSEHEFSVSPSVLTGIDFLIADSAENKLTFPNYTPLVLRGVFKDPALYRLRIVVQNNDTHANIRVQVDWRGQWDTVTGKPATV